MSLKHLNAVCYTICIVCILSGVAMALIMIWGELHDDLAWKSMLTISVLFLASTLTLSINRMIDRPARDDG